MKDAAISHGNVTMRAAACPPSERYDANTLSICWRAASAASIAAVLAFAEGEATAYGKPACIIMAVSGVCMKAQGDAAHPQNGANIAAGFGCGKLPQAVVVTGIMSAD